MASRVVLALLLGLLCASPSFSAASHDYYTLVLQWPGAYCSQSRCCRPTTGTPAEDFLIRGLWACNSTTGKPVTKCRSTPFDPSELEGLEKEMYEHWSYLRCPSNDGTQNWKNIWKTYGSCSGMKEGPYFETGLDLFYESNVLSGLRDRGIVPTENKTYSVASIERAIETKIKVKPVIRCSRRRDGGMQLYEVYICVDEYAKSPIECPVKPRFYCPAEVAFTPFDDNMLKIVPVGTNDLPANIIHMPVSVE